MISAFGVEHGSVYKSLVGGDWVKAAELTAAQRKKVGGYKKARGVSRTDRKFLGESKERKDFIALHGNKPESIRISPTLQMRTGFKSQAVTFRRGGKKGGSSHIVGEGMSHEDMEPTLRHERWHAQPRSEYRVHQQIHKTPSKLGGEEGAADMEGMGHYSHQRANVRTTGVISPYATGRHHDIMAMYPHFSEKQAKETVKAYESVQDKILAARGGKSSPRNQPRTPPPRKAAPKPTPTKPKPLTRRIVNSRMAQRFLRQPSS